MKKVLLFSHSGFSNENANGITMKNLLSGFTPEEKAEFYCDVQPPDFSAAHRYFRVTDMQMLKAFVGKKAQHVFSYERNDSPKRTVPEKHQSQQSPRRIPAWLKKHKYNFALKWIRELLWQISPWGHKQLMNWIRDVAPDVIVYMVGESIFMDQLVMKTCAQMNKPLVLYNGEAYRIINVSMRHGLERWYYRKAEKMYAKLHKMAALVIYNCHMLKNDYEKMYSEKAESIVAYNTAECDPTPYIPNESVQITYFGNLGVGRSETLIKTASVLKRINPKLYLDIYGNALAADARRFAQCSNIRYHGFVNAEQLREIVRKSDILLHVESFDDAIVPRLKYAFSTKIAQCLCAGRCFVSYAPLGTASSQYLDSIDGAILVSDDTTLECRLRELIADPAMREEYAHKSLKMGRQNHELYINADRVRKKIEAVL